VISAIGANSSGASISASGMAASVTPQPRLVKAAHEFEAQMLKEMLKPLTSDSTLGSEDEDSSVGSSGALGEFASEALGKAISEGGGFGIANRVLHDLNRSSNQKVIGK
jgi:Rod binding domain-containing protein